jgi:hypothetical protein
MPCLPTQVALQHSLAVILDGVGGDVTAFRDRYRKLRLSVGVGPAADFGAALLSSASDANMQQVRRPWLFDCGILAGLMCTIRAMPVCGRRPAANFEAALTRRCECR